MRLPAALLGCAGASGADELEFGTAEAGLAASAPDGLAATALPASCGGSDDAVGDVSLGVAAASVRGAVSAGRGSEPVQRASATTAPSAKSAKPINARSRFMLEASRPVA